MTEERLRQIEESHVINGGFIDDLAVQELIQEVRRLQEENKRYREALEKIRDMHRLTHSVTDAIDVAKKALEGGESAT